MLVLVDDTFWFGSMDVGMERRRFKKDRGRFAFLERQEVWYDAKELSKVGNGLLEVFGYAFWVLPNAPVVFMELMSQSKEEYESHVKMIVETLKEEKMYMKFSNGAKRKLSRCGRNQMGNEPILALPEGADDFVVYYDARSKDLEACLEKGRRLSNRWLSMKKDVASCGSKYLAYSRMEIEYQGSSGLLLQPELPKTSRVDFRVLMPQVVKSRDEIFSRWGYCDNHDLSRDSSLDIVRYKLHCRILVREREEIERDRSCSKAVIRPYYGELFDSERDRLNIVNGFCDLERGSAQSDD
ncbi:hypothetical protein Tco_1300471 [Tanacetum coccineum]